MIINFSKKTHTLWHSDCKEGEHSPPMIEVDIDKDKGRTLMKCARCGKAGHYPHGGIGKIKVEEVDT